MHLVLKDFCKVYLSFFLLAAGGVGGSRKFGEIEWKKWNRETQSILGIQSEQPKEVGQEARNSFEGPKILFVDGIRERRGATPETSGTGGEFSRKFLC